MVQKAKEIKTNLKTVNVLTMESNVDTDVLTEKKTVTKKLHDLIVHNDNVNSFDFVIQTLVDVCSHDWLQAEQCAHLIHYMGKCSVKRGTFKKLQPLCYALLDRKISATIE